MRSFSEMKKMQKQNQNQNQKEEWIRTINPDLSKKLDEIEQKLDDKTLKTVKKAVFDENYDLILNPTEIEVSSGNQKFGSGNYKASWKVIKGEVEEVSSKVRETDFISAIDTILRPKQKETVISCLEYDMMKDYRYFKKFIAVFL